MKNILQIFLLCSFILVSCNTDKVNPVIEDDCRVYIAASLKGNSYTKTPYVPYDDADDDPDIPTNTRPLRSVVWASSTPWEYLDKSLDGTQYDPILNPGIPYEVAYHTKANFQSGGPQLLADIIYSKTDTPPIYFVSMTPNSDWQTTDGTQAVREFHGYEDIMFAPQVDGQYGKKDAFGNSVWPTLHFHHLLTWIRIEVKAESEEVSAVWGKLTDLSIESHKTVTIDLSQTYDASCVTFTDIEDMKFYAKDTDNIYPAAGGSVIPLTTEEVAYVLCSPVDAKIKDTESDDRIPEYTLKITTEHRAINLPIDLKTADDIWFGGSTMGKQFTISLTFRMGNNITTGVTVKEWIAEGVCGGNLTE